MRRGSRLIHCPICNEPVSLERCKTDENGRAIHERCYVGKLCCSGNGAAVGSRNAV